MNFGEILKKWEKQNKGTEGSFNKDAALKAGVFGERKEKGHRRNKILRKKPDAIIDLHGFNGEEAWTALETFFSNSREMGHEKLLVIHGKGNHTVHNGVLKDIARRFIERCSFAGESGFSSAREGGTGSTWVILKEKG